MATTVLDGVSAFLAESHGLFIGGEKSRHETASASTCTIPQPVR
jgi:hypothetical protein